MQHIGWYISRRVIGFPVNKLNFELKNREFNKFFYHFKNTKTFHQQTDAQQ